MGGLTKAINRVAIYSLILSIFILYLLLNIVRIKKNYTVLWDKVNNIEAKVKNLQRGE